MFNIHIIPINILVANGLIIHGDDVLIQQQKKVHLHASSSGKSLGKSPNGRSSN
jgi:hypothetical protein